MKRTTIFFWLFSGLLIPALGIGSVQELLSNPDAIKQYTDLGYPAYLAPFMGLARLSVLLMINVPAACQRLKEWAYAGLVFDIVGAAYSQIAA